MKAAVIDAFGDATTLQVREVSEPEISAGQILVLLISRLLNCKCCGSRLLYCGLSFKKSQKRQ